MKIEKWKRKRKEREMSYIVYILKSTNEKTPNRTYVGITNNMKIRLRQHNGEIKGGARQTRTGRPYELVCYVQGFEGRNDAQSFEWFCHHPAGRPRRRGKGQLRSRFDKYKGIERREMILRYYMKKERWNHLELVWE